MTLPAIVALLKRVPAIAYVIAFAVLLCAVGAWGLYASGRRAGEVRVHRKALADSIEKATIVQKLAVQQTDQSRRDAVEKTRLSDSGRVIRNRLRESVVPLLDSLPDPVVRLIQADDQQIKRDSVTIAAFVAVDSTWLRERLLSADLDSLHINQAALGVDKPHHGRTALYVVGGVVATVGAVLLYHAVR